MPEVGDIKIDYEVNGQWRKLIWSKCSNCGRERWLTAYQKNRISCAVCSRPRGEHAYNWRGGRQIDKHGYIRIKLSKDSPFYSMANARGYIAEHRLVMAQYLGRPLIGKEIVHHADGVRIHNDIENLVLGTKKTHELSYKDGYARGLKENAGSIKVKVRNMNYLAAEWRYGV